jgi:F0F1-type ATP synthase assembly protein I
MDFKFKYRRGRPVPAELKREEAEAAEDTLRARGMALGLSIPAYFISGIGGSYFLGRWLDGRFQTNYWLIVCLLLGIVGSFALVIMQLTRIGKLK